MDTLDFKISINEHYDRIDSILLYGLIAIVPLSYIVIFYPAFEYLMIIILIIITLVFYLIVPLLIYFKKKKQKFKILNFKEDSLIVENDTITEINYLEIKRITLIYKSTKSDNWGDWIGTVRSFIAIPSTGQDNTIKIIKKNGEKTVINIWCENDADYWRIRSLGSFLKEKGIDIKMKGFLRDN